MDHGKVLRVIAILLLGMTAAMNLLGGAGTFCAAFSNNVGYRMAFKAIMDYRWIYQIVMVTTHLNRHRRYFGAGEVAQRKTRCIPFHNDRIDHWNAFGRDTILRIHDSKRKGNSRKRKILYQCGYFGLLLHPRITRDQG